MLSQPGPAGPRDQGSPRPFLAPSVQQQQSCCTCGRHHVLTTQLHAQSSMTASLLCCWPATCLTRVCQLQPKLNTVVVTHTAECKTTSVYICAKCASQVDSQDRCRQCTSRCSLDSDVCAPQQLLQLGLQLQDLPVALLAQQSCQLRRVVGHPSVDEREVLEAQGICTTNTCSSTAIASST